MVKRTNHEKTGSLIFIYSLVNIKLFSLIFLMIKWIGRYRRH